MHALSNLQGIDLGSKRQSSRASIRLEGQNLQKVNLDDPRSAHLMILGDPEIRNEMARVKEGVCVLEDTWEKIVNIMKRLELD